MSQHQILPMPDVTCYQCRTPIVLRESLANARKVNGKGYLYPLCSEECREVFEHEDNAAGRKVYRVEMED